MRLLIDATGAAGSGAGQTRLGELARELPEQSAGHDVTLAVHAHQACAFRDAARPLRVVAPPRGVARPLPRIAWQLVGLPRVARRLECDVVLGVFNVVATRWPRPRPRVALMVSNLLPFHRELGVRVPARQVPRLELLRRLTLAGIESADLVVLQSAFAAEVLGDIVGDRRTAVIRHTPPGHGPPTARRPAAGRPFALAVADREPYKGLHVVLEAAAAIAPRARPHLLVVGGRTDPGYGRRLDRLVAGAGLAGDVTWLGPRSHAEVLDLMAAATLCIACSHFENFSRVPGEAMAMGAPLICTDIPPHREAAGSSALYYEPDDAGALARHIELVLTCRAERDRLGAHARAAVAATTQTSAAGQLVAVLEDLAA